MTTTLSAPVLHLADLGRLARRRGGALLTDNFFAGSSRIARLHPLAQQAHRELQIVRDLPYLPDEGPDHTLDVWRPRDRFGPLPVVLYVHGGGFRILSKDTHWVMAQAFAREGYLVFNINYRLAPRHPYPAAIEDACAALAFVVEHAKEYGGDPSRLVLAGESAGGNLVTALAVAASYARPESWARRLFERTPPPAAVVASCGILQVSDTERFRRRRPLPAFLFDRIDEVREAYLSNPTADPAGGVDLADPLLVLERSAPSRPLPPFFAFAGTKDPLLDDTRRLGAALARHRTPHLVRFYPGEIHAFHAMVWREQARRCWQECFAFLSAQLAAH
jgi:acetyl esterase